MVARKRQRKGRRIVEGGRKEEYEEKKSRERQENRGKEGRKEWDCRSIGGKVEGGREANTSFIYRLSLNVDVDSVQYCELCLSFVSLLSCYLSGTKVPAVTRALVLN